MERERFFDGQLLTAAEFEAEQRYHLEKRRLHNRMLHGFGVVDGLGVSVPDGTDTAVVVSPGFALDRSGNEIIVEAPVRIDPNVCTGGMCFVTIQYTETATGPVPTTNGGVQFSRVREGFAVGIAMKNPDGSADAQQLGLARLVRPNGRWLVDETYPRRTL
jgi:hypothetical protein